MKKDYTKLRELLTEQESFPIQYLHKFIGKNSPEFSAAVVSLEKSFPKLRNQYRRESGGGAHVAYTYIIEADTVDEIIRVLEAMDGMPDLVLVL